MAVKLLFFWERGCPNCIRAYNAVRDAVVNTDRDTRILEMEINKHHRLARKYQVEGTPALVVLDRGKKPIVVMGCLTPEGYWGYLEKFISGPSKMTEEEKKIDLVTRNG